MPEIHGLKNKVKKVLTPDQQKAKDKKMAEYHKEQAKLEPMVTREIDKQADKAIRLYRNKKDYTETRKQEIKAEIINRIANGQSLTSICNNVSHMPAPKTVLEWVEKDPAFGKEYSRARNHQAEVLFAQIIDIADNRSNDLIDGKDGAQMPNHAAIQRDKLMVETRFRMIGKLNGRYADKPSLVGDGANVTVNNLSINPRDMSPDSRDKLRKLLLEAKGSVIDN